MSGNASVPIRLVAALVVAAGGILPWFLTPERSDGLTTLVFGLYRDRWFLLNAAASVAAIECLVLLWAPTRKRMVNLVLLNVSIAFAVTILELPAILGFMDLQTIGETYTAAPGQGVSRVSAPGLQIQGESWPDLVDVLGVKADRRPYDISTDRFGLRNAETREDPDIVCVGDSMLYAGFVSTEDLLTERLGDLLGATVLNVSEPGLSPEEEMNRFTMTGISIEDRMFLHFIFEGNDLVGSAAFANESAWAWPDSGVLKYILRKLHAPRRGLAETRMGRFPGRQSTPDVYFYYDAETIDGSIDHLEDLADFLARCRQRFSDAGSEYIVVFVPMKLSVMGPYCQWPEGNRLSEPHFWSSRFRTELGPLCEARSVPFFDLTADLQIAAEAGEVVYFPDDTHLNARGHEIMAESLARYLRASTDAAADS